jgi:hypothetical protein
MYYNYQKATEEEDCSDNWPMSNLLETIKEFKYEIKIKRF